MDNEKISREHFDSLATVYDLNDGEYISPLPKLACDRAIALIGDTDSICDIGCGTGYLLLQLAKRNPEIIGAGVDISPNMLARAKAKLASYKNVDLCCATADTLPSKDEQYSAVTCIMSFHHYPYPEKAIKEANRVLKKGGKCILADPLRQTGTLEESIEEKNTDLETGEYAIYRPEEIAEFMKNNGFEKIEIEYPSDDSFLIIASKK